MSYDFEFDATKTRLEDSLKARYEPGSMRPRLYETFNELGAPCDPRKFEWMYYAGMGSVGLHDTTEQVTKAALDLLNAGRIVPTFKESFYGIKDICLIQHFDDVRFGLITSGEIVIYDLLPKDVPNLPDPVIMPDESHSVAIAKLRERMNYPFPNYAVVIDESPLQLRGGPVIRPLITDPGLAAQRLRQMAFDKA
jgi:hypothetical protein